MYLTGESFAGYYIPYIANGFIEANDTEYFNFKGAAINDPIIGNTVIQFQSVAMQYVNTWANVFGFTPAVLASLNAQNEKCGYADYVNKYLTFPPPPAPFPGPFGNKAFGETGPNDCNIQDDILNAVSLLNPCFNEDHIFDTCPIPYTLLGAGFLADFNPSGPAVWYNRPDVKAALHAPNITWEFITSNNIYVGPNTTFELQDGDDSFPPAQIGIVSRMIEATNNIIVGVGGLDFQLPANGTLLVFQNMTWNGGQGFSAFPNETLFVPNYPQGVDGQLTGVGDLGTWTSERGFTFYISHWAGHEDPWYTPGVAYRVVQDYVGSHTQSQR